MSMQAFLAALEMGFIYSFLAFGLYISFRILNLADLTSDGSFAFGGAVSAVLTLAGHPFLGILMGAFAGAVAGFITAFLQTTLKIAPILSGIITMTALYSINLNVMGSRANINLLRVDTIFTHLGNRLFVLSILSVLTVFILYLFLKTRLGLSLRATGDNVTMVRASSINPAATITLGLMLANALVALSGSLLAQYQLFCEVTMGTGVVVLGLASLIIGEVVLLCYKRVTIIKGLFSAVVGALIYRIIMAAALELNIKAQNLKLFSAVIVIIAISYPTLSNYISFLKMRKGARLNAEA